MKNNALPRGLTYFRKGGKVAKNRKAAKFVRKEKRGQSERSILTLLLMQT